jgi:hypothetical protein
MQPYNRRPGANISEAPSSKHEIAKQMLHAQAYRRDQRTKDHIDLYVDHDGIVSQNGFGWTSGVDGNGFNKIYYPNTPRMSIDIMKEFVNQSGIVKKQSLLRGYTAGSPNDPFTMQLERDILERPSEYYKGDYRVGRGLGIEPAEEGSEGFYDSLNDNYSHLTVNDPHAMEQLDILQSMGEHIDRTTPHKYKRNDPYYGSTSTFRR